MYVCVGWGGGVCVYVFVYIPADRQANESISFSFVIISVYMTSN